jgi:hypothetical protein
VGKDQSLESLGCSEQVKLCSASKVVLFSGPSELGPFQPIAELKKGRTTLPLSDKKIKAIALSPGGVASQAADVTSPTS